MRRAVCTRKVNESFQHTAHDLFAAAAAAADRPNSSSSSTQQRGQRVSGGGQLRASEPPIVRLVTPCLDGCALFGSVTCALCHLVIYVPVVVRDWIYLVDVCVAPGVCYYLKHVRPQKPSQK